MKCTVNICKLVNVLTGSSLTILQKSLTKYHTKIRDFLANLHSRTILQKTNIQTCKVKIFAYDRCSPSTCNRANETLATNSHESRGNDAGASPKLPSVQKTWRVKPSQSPPGAVRMRVEENIVDTVRKPHTMKTGQRENTYESPTL